MSQVRCMPLLCLLRLGTVFLRQSVLAIPGQWVVSIIVVIKPDFHLGVRDDDASGVAEMARLDRYVYPVDDALNRREFKGDALLISPPSEGGEGVVSHHAPPALHLHEIGRALLGIIGALVVPSRGAGGRECREAYGREKDTSHCRITLAMSRRAFNPIMRASRG